MNQPALKGHSSQSLAHLHTIRAEVLFKYGSRKSMCTGKAFRVHGLPGPNFRCKQTNPR
jgi:hypothetical protein